MSHLEIIQTLSEIVEKQNNIIRCQADALAQLGGVCMEEEFHVGGPYPHAHKLHALTDGPDAGLIIQVKGQLTEQEDFNVRFPAVQRLLVRPQDDNVVHVPDVEVDFQGVLAVLVQLIDPGNQRPVRRRGNEPGGV